MLVEIDISPLKKSLTQYQRNFLYNPHRFTSVIASTKVGKTYSLIVWFLEKTLRHPKSYGEFWWVAPIKGTAKIAYKRLKRALIHFGIFKFNDTIQSISVGNKVMMFKSADEPDSLYGEDVWAVVFDEFTRASFDAFVALRTTTTKTRAPIKLIGNYTGETNWGVRLAEEQKDNPEWAFFKVTAFDAVDAGILDIEEVEQARKDLPKEMFDALYLATGGYEPDRLIQSAAINDLFTNDFVPHGKPAITADIAMQGSDQFVVMVWSGFRLVKCYSYPKTNGKQVLENILTIAKEYGVPQSRIAYDRDGLGAYLEGGFLPNALPFNGGASGGKVYFNRKAKIHYQCAKRINESGYYVEPDAFTHGQKTAFVKELSAIKSDKSDKDVKLRVMDKSKVKQAIGRSPDYADAFVMREHIENFEL